MDSLLSKTLLCVISQSGNSHGFTTFWWKTLQNGDDDDDDDDGNDDNGDDDDDDSTDGDVMGRVHGHGDDASVDDRERTGIYLKKIIIKNK